MSILYEQLEEYLLSFLDYEDGLLGDVQKEALENKIPIISKDTISFIKTILSIKKPKFILEVGTAVGFSSSLMSNYIVNDGKIITIERYEPMIIKAKENFLKLGLEDKIQLLEGDALDIIKNIQGNFDIIFLDGAKSQYINILPDCLRLLNDNGIIIADNILQKGTVANDLLEIPRRHRTIHRRMNSFLEDIMNMAEFQSSIVPIGDGVLVAHKTK